METAYVSYIQVNEIDENLKANKYIEDAASIIIDDVALIALVVKPMYSRLYKQKFIEEITKEVLNRTNLKEVIVTFDTDLFYEITKCQKTNDTVRMRELIEIARSRN